MEYLSNFVQAFFYILDSHDGLLTVLGWFTVFFFGVRATKIQQRNSVRLEIYRELHTLKSRVDRSSIELGVLLSKYSLPFLAMEWAEKSSVGLGEGKTPGQLWLENNKKIIDAISHFEENNQAFLNATSIWISIMPNLKTARNILAAEFGGLSKVLWTYNQFHRNQSLNEYDWKKWDKINIENETEKVRDKFDRVAAGFLNDFTDLLHDELMCPIFSTKKVPREEFNYVRPTEAETLTKKGIKVIRYPITEVATLFREKRDEIVDSSK